MPAIVQTENLSFAYGHQRIIDDLTMTVNEGEIFGFVGPNGAGKSTTIKLLLGLLTPQGGSIALFGRELQSNRTEILRRIGSLIEMPALYPHLTARENLEVVSAIYNVPPSRCDDVLQLTGISGAGEKKAKEFSLGMKQRLGIALALLHSPRFLILDEPINGLDPAGIQEFRFFIKRVVSEQGVTVLVSSHILSELEQLITTVGIIAHGKMKYLGSLSGLKGSRQGELKVQVSDPKRSVTLLRPFYPRIAVIGDQRISFPSLDRSDAAAINAMLVKHAIDVYEITFEQPNLETIFLDMVQTKGAL